MLSIVFFFIFIFILLLIIGYGVSLYNQLVMVKNMVSKSWANIDVLLKQRHDELSKLIEVCKQYMHYEEDLLKKLTQLRIKAQAFLTQTNVENIGETEAALQKNIKSLLAVAENYPDLKANQSFLQLQTRLSALENAIADRRELYNDSVNANNICVEQFPNVIIAKCFSFNKTQLLNFKATELTDVDFSSLSRNP